MSDENSTIRIVDVGRAIPLVKGAWHAETAYEMLDIVSYTGYTYIARTNVEAGILPTDTDHWMLVAGSITNWGDIYGQIENQGDLRDALDAKLNAADAGTMAAVDDAPNNGSPYLRKGEEWYNADDRYYTETEMNTKLNAKANLASPTFTGTPKAPTAAAGTNTTQLATTAFVQTGLSGKSDTGHTHDDRYYTETEMDTKLAAKADLASPTFTGTPKAPNAAKGTNTQQIATTSFVAVALVDKQDKLTFDSTPTASSTNPVTSGGVKSALDLKAPLASPTLTGTPAAPTAAKGTNTTQIATTAFVAAGLADKQDELTFDDTPTAGSSNPVKSSGIKSGLDEKVSKSGDSITGRLNIMMPNADASASTIPAGVSNYLQWKGLNEKPLTALGSEQTTAGFVRTLLLARHYINGDTYVDNSIYLGVYPNGERSVELNAPAEWRSALGVYAKNEVNDALDLKAPLASPTLTGTPQAPTAAKGTNSTQIATTEFVQTGLSDKQNTLTFDDTPTTGSSNPVKSSGIKSGLDGKVAKSGDDITGRLTFIMPDADSSASSIPVSAANYLQWKGPNGKALTALGSEENTQGIVRTLLLARHYINGNTPIDNSIYLSVDSTGKRSVELNAPAEWQSALGVYAKNEVNAMITNNIETSETASKSYSAGNLIILNGQLLRATTGIGIGGTITVGTNAEVVTLETLLAELSA